MVDNNRRIEEGKHCFVVHDAVKPRKKDNPREVEKKLPVIEKTDKNWDEFLKVWKQEPHYELEDLPPIERCFWYYMMGRSHNV